MIARPRLKWAATLPISSGVRLLMQVGPFLVVGAGGVALGMATRGHASLYSLSARGQSTNTPGEWYHNPSKVALTYWHTAPQHRQPTITAPWGESVPADTITVFGRTHFNPYTSRESISEQFIEWQFGRATEAVYGRSLTQAEYESIPHRDRPRTAAQQPAALAFRLMLMVVLMLLYALLFEASTWYRPAQWQKAVRYAYFGLLFVPLLLPLGIVLAPLILVDPLALMVDELQLALLHHSGQRWAPVLLLTGMLAVLAWRLLLWQFTQSEYVPRQRTEKTPAPARTPELRIDLQTAR